MPRPKRYEIEDGWYHVINRGAARRYIFLNDDLKTLFLDTLGYVVERYDFKIYAFCIMGNHYHLLINTVHANLGSGMRTLNSMYAQKFNGMRKKDGPVFKGRYKSYIIQDKRYLNNTLRYIHLNPVRAGIVKDPSFYAWSSHLDYEQNTARFEWLEKLYWESSVAYQEYVEKISAWTLNDRRGQVKIYEVYGVGIRGL